MHTFSSFYKKKFIRGTVDITITLHLNKKF